MIAAMALIPSRTNTRRFPGQTPEGIKLTAHVDTATSQVDGNKMMMKSPGVIVPMTGATSVVEIELVKADKDLAYGHVVETMDRVRRAGVERVGMVTEPLPRRE